ncbi:MAG TPA: YbaN family protein [Woeseiaceae bacterium]|nr:YbaN family protein [Woeseiaceae bacterium]
MRANIRFFWLLAGLAAVAIGAIGVVLPLLPTTPFLLAAAFAFARSSDRLNSWLRKHRMFGPLIDNWHREGSIDRKSKQTAIAVIVATPAITWLLDAPLWVLACQIAVLSVAATYILTRPSPSEYRR